MLTDCLKYCSILLPVQIERAKFHEAPYLFPTTKTVGPFHTFAIDIITGLDPTTAGYTILVVCVCVFTKWIEAAVLPSRSSATIRDWFHANIVCRFGKPAAVRSD